MEWATEPRPVNGLEKQQSGRDSGHLPNLDGLRTLAALSVLFGHCNHFTGVTAPGTAWDWIRPLVFQQFNLGVQFFFVLSGFLITRIIVRQQNSSQGFSLRQFWLRRVVRIWPVYFLVAALAWLLTFTGWPDYAMPNNSWPLTLTFLANLDLMRMFADGLQFGYVVSVLWSVSIEEQFYLVYPLLLILLPGRGRVPFFCLGILMTTALRYQLQLSDFHIISASSQLGVGCLMGLLLPGAPAWADRLPRWLLTLPYLGLLVTMLLPPNHLTRLQPLLFAAIVFDQAFCPQSWLQTRRVPLLNRLGKITYGLYSYHMIFVICLLEGFRRAGHPPATVGTFLAYVGMVVLTSVAASLFSYRFYESPFLALTSK